MKSLKKLVILPILLLGLMASAQETANRFFYELSFKPKKDSTRIDKVMTVLDITKDKSIYQDFTIPAQDSIIKKTVEDMEKSGTFVDIMKTIKMPKFSYKVYKTYPSMKELYTDMISRKFFGFEEELKFDWMITTDKEKIGEYNTQKATTEFGGRKWTAWFSADIPFQDGPYKFYGLPGLIVKIEDENKNYSWLLSGNKKIDNYSEKTESDKINEKYGVNYTPTITSKDKFEKSYDAYKKDPLAEMRPYLTQEAMSKPMPGGSGQTVGEFVKNQEKIAKDFFNANDNPIEVPQITEKKKK